MNISLYKVSLNDKTLLDNLLQLYLYDLSEFVPLEISPQGKYEQTMSPKYVSSFDKSAYIIHAELHIIGFVLVEPYGEYIKINDLFVLNMWRNKGVGSAVVNILLKKGKPLLCEFHTRNELAKFFWTNIMKNPLHKLTSTENAEITRIKVEY
jgi:predicted acetyltransferase